MRGFLFASTCLMSVAIARPVVAADKPPSPPPALGDMCDYPAGWAPPFTHTYRLKNGAILVFVAVEHTHDPNDATHRQIKAAFDRYRPDTVLVEGASSSKSTSTAYLTYLADTARRQKEAGAIGENLYAVALASNANLPVSGWDFSPDQDYRVLVEDGFDIRDALGAHLLRSHIDPFTGTGGSNEIANQLRYARTVTPIGDFDYAAWYRQAYGSRFDPANGTPCGSGVGSRAVRDLSYRRNLNLIDVIDRYAKPGKTALLEAGAGHWLALKSWLAEHALSVE